MIEFFRGVGWGFVGVLSAATAFAIIQFARSLMYLRRRRRLMRAFDRSGKFRNQ